MKTIDVLAKVFGASEHMKKREGRPVAYFFGNMLFGFSVFTSATALYLMATSNQWPNAEGSKVVAEFLGTFMALSYGLDRVKNKVYDFVAPRAHAKLRAWMGQPATLENRL